MKFNLKKALKYARSTIHIFNVPDNWDHGLVGYDTVPLIGKSIGPFQWACHSTHTPPGLTGNPNPGLERTTPSLSLQLILRYVHVFVPLYSTSSPTASSLFSPPSAPSSVVHWVVGSPPSYLPWLGTEIKA